MLKEKYDQDKKTIQEFIDVLKKKTETGEIKWERNPYLPWRYYDGAMHISDPYVTTVDHIGKIMIHRYDDYELNTHGFMMNIGTLNVNDPVGGGPELAQLYDAVARQVQSEMQGKSLDGLVWTSSFSVDAPEDYEKIAGYLSSSANWKGDI